VHVPYFLSHYDPDPLRCYLTATAPETRCTEPALPVPSAAEGRAPKGLWEDFVERNDNALAATARLSSVEALASKPGAGGGSRDLCPREAAQAPFDGAQGDLGLLG